jgi:hypothetical protein
MRLKPLIFIAFVGTAACQQAGSTQHTIHSPATKLHPVEAAALHLTEKPYVTYDASYQSIAYPMGDVAPNRGVCADVVVRAFRQAGIDLQQLVHEDMQHNFASYPKKWGLRQPDPNIDHRRVPNLMRYFERRGWNLPVSANPEDYQPGDIVAWHLQNGSLTHIGIVVYTADKPGKPQIVHNIGSGQRIDDVLFAWEIIGHYRMNE